MQNEHGLGGATALCSPAYPGEPPYLRVGLPGEREYRHTEKKCSQEPAPSCGENHNKEKAKRCTFEEEMLRESLYQDQNIEI